MGIDEKASKDVSRGRRRWFTAALQDPRVTAPFMAIAVAQVVAFFAGFAHPHVEDGIVGMVMMESALPMHGLAGHPWLLICFPVICTLCWEILETVRSPTRISRPNDLPRWAGRRAAGLVLATVAVLIFNFAAGLVAIFILLAFDAMFQPEFSGQTVILVLVGLAYPIPLGYLAVWAYRSRLPLPLT